MHLVKNVVLYRKKSKKRTTAQVYKTEKKNKEKKQQQGLYKKDIESVETWSDITATGTIVGDKLPNLILFNNSLNF